jgi:ferrochelatase
MTKKKGILIVNLGTPKSSSKKDVKSYLSEFLMDKYVIDLPFLLRSFLVKGIILNTRPKKSAAAYKKIWTEQGSPLLFNSENLVKKLKNNFSNPIELAMRYGQPSIKNGLKNLTKKGCKDILVVPLYPQYAMSTTQTVNEKVIKEAQLLDESINLSFVPPFYNHPSYIKVLSEKIKIKLKPNSYLLFSYHGIPVRHLYKTTPSKSHQKQDNNCCKVGSETSQKCYLHQSLEITKAVVTTLKLKENQFETVFQSRLGRDPWLEPAAADRFEKLPQEGHKNLLVVTPSFVSDCLETIEEIGIEGKKSFLEKGGKTFNRINCLNDDNQWVDTLSEIIQSKLEN